MLDARISTKVSGLGLFGSALLVTLAVVGWWLMDAQTASLFPTLLGTAILLVMTAGALALAQRGGLAMGVLLGTVLGVGLCAVAFLALAISVGS